MEQEKKVTLKEENSLYPSSYRCSLAFPTCILLVKGQAVCGRFFKTRAILLLVSSLHSLPDLASIDYLCRTVWLWFLQNDFPNVSVIGLSPLPCKNNSYHHHHRFMHDLLSPPPSPSLLPLLPSFSFCFIH